MLKQLLTRGLAICLLALGLQSASAQTFWTENFNNQASATSNWVHGGTNAGTETWKWSNDPAAGQWQPGDFVAPTAASGYMWFDSDINGDGFAHDVTLTGTGVPANCTGKTDVHLRFHTYYRTFDDTDVVSVGVSTNGTTFTYYSFAQLDDLAGEGIYNGMLDLDLPQADNQAQVWIQFRYDGIFQYYWKVDDIQMYDGAPTVPSHNVTFKVNMATQPSVDPAGVRIAGTFTNWADELMTDEGNGVWSITKSLQEGAAVQYKFKNGPNGWEPGQALCGVNDGNGGFNRTYTVGQDDAVLTTVCFNSCGPCSGLPCNLNPDAIICDNFDAYNPALKLGPQATHWTTWSGTEGTTEDGIVSTEQSSSPSNSLKILSTAAAGGPQDVILNLGSKTTGRYELNWKMFIPTGKQGYYNFQNVVPLVGGNGDWALDVFYGPGGKGFAVRAGAVGLDTFYHFTYVNSAWFDVSHIIDLDNNTISMSINGAQVGKTSYAKNLGGIDFYGTNNLNQYYVDDVEYIKLPAAVFNADLCDSAVDINGLFGAVEGTIVTSAVQSNATATTSPTDPTTGIDCFFETDGFQNTNYYAFVGDGGTYNISSKACGGTPIGDTQFALYSGECGSFTPLGCDDDGGVNLYSALDVTTQEGVTYYLIVDGYFDATNNVQAAGSFCIDVVRGKLVTCADAQVGTVEVSNNGIVCWGGASGDIVTIDDATWTVPTQGPAGGLSWCWTDVPLEPGVWPGVPSGLVNVSPPLVKAISPFSFSLPNDGSQSFAQPGTYYMTPVLVAGATLSNAAGSSQMWNLLEPDPATGCFFIGESIPITFVPEVNPIAAFSVSTPGSTAGNVDIELTIAGGYPEVVGDPNIADYIYEWDPNVSDSGIATNVPNVPYTVIISDPTGCTDPLVLDIATGTVDPKSVQNFTITPNPTAGLVNVNISLEKAADVQIDVVNTLGQTMQTIQGGHTANLSQSIDMGRFAAGTYSIRVRMDNETAVRRVVLQK